MKRHTVDQGNNAARILNMAVSSQLQHQQNFRLHQQRYLAPNPNRKPSEDDLFEMASMLLDPPREKPKANWMDRSTMVSSYQSMNNNNNNKSPGFYGDKYITQMSILRNSSPTNVSSGDLFDDDELDSVLGDVTQPSKEQHSQTITPETSERTNRESDNFLPEITLEEMLHNSEQPTQTEDKNQDQWCLIDFGDDKEQDSGLSSTTKKRPSLEGVDGDMVFPFKKTRQ